MKTTLKNIKSYVSTGAAEDITRKSFDEINAIRQEEGWFSEEMFSMGIYGVTGVLLKGAKSGRLYAITARTSALFQIH